jgi:hypothetical protein
MGVAALVGRKTHCRIFWFAVGHEMPGAFRRNGGLGEVGGILSATSFPNF